MKNKIVLGLIGVMMLACMTGCSSFTPVNEVEVKSETKYGIEMVISMGQYGRNAAQTAITISENNVIKTVEADDAVAHNVTPKNIYEGLICVKYDNTDIDYKAKEIDLCENLKK